MSINLFNAAHDFVPAPVATQNNGFFAVIGKTFSAVREGIELASEYKELTNRGMASEVAARKVFEKIGR